MTTAGGGGSTTPGNGTAPAADDATNNNKKNAKQQAYDAVRAHVRLYFDEGAISRDEYKKIARIATRQLYQQHGGAPPDDEPNSQEVAHLVDEAMITVIRSGTPS
jgi:hypothetical protein